MMGKFKSIDKNRNEFERATDNEVHIIRIEEDGIYFDLHANMNNDMPWIDGTFLSWDDLWAGYSREKGTQTEMGRYGHIIPKT